MPKNEVCLRISKLFNAANNSVISFLADKKLKALENSQLQIHRRNSSFYYNIVHNHKFICQSITFINPLRKQRLLLSLSRNKEIANLSLSLLLIFWGNPISKFPFLVLFHWMKELLQRQSEYEKVHHSLSLGNRKIIILLFSKSE